MIKFFIRVLQKMINALYRLQKPARFDEEKHLAGVIASTSHDMLSDPDEQYYADQYWEWIGFKLDHEKVSGGRFLDLGCGQGRMSLKLAERDPKAEIVGVDISESATQQAKKYAKERGLTNVRYETGDILAFLSAQKSGLFDAVLFLEVSFFMPNYAAVLMEARRVLKKDGLIFASFRSQYFDAMYSIAHHDWESARTVLRSSEGKLWGSDITFTWQTSRGIKYLFERERFRLLELAGIGTMSGIEGDPHALVARPSQLSEKERELLSALESSTATAVPDAGRYMLAIAKKDDTMKGDQFECATPYLTNLKKS